MSSNYTNPELASVLRTLASYSTIQPTPLAAPALPPLPQTAPQPFEAEEYDPSTFRPLPTAPLSRPSPSIPPHPASHPPQPRPSSSSSSSTTAFSSSTTNLPLSSCATTTLSASQITTWPSALRHVMKHVVPNPASARRIQRLMATQQEHERQWWRGRQALVTKQRGREEGRRRLDDVLASVGGLVNPLSHDSSPQTDLSELHLYDAKVHRACMSMAADAAAELAALGVPFFDIGIGLVRRGGERGVEGGGDEEGEGESGKERGKESGEREKLDEGELHIFKRRMMGLLEDLCAE